MHKYYPTAAPSNTTSIRIVGFEQLEELGEGGKKERRIRLQLAVSHPWQPGKSMLLVVGLHAKLSGEYRLQKGAVGS